MNRRAFTLIELALASAMGAVLLLGCVTVFMTLSRADQTHARRAKEIAQLERTQTVVQRAFMSLAIDGMTSEPPPGAGGGATTRRPTPTGQPTPGAPRPPRLLLSGDSRLSRYTMAPPRQGARVVVVWRDQTPQRLEIVVARPPVGDVVRVPPEAAPPGLVLSEGATRGAFELVPGRATEDGRTLWTLVWRTFGPAIPEGHAPAMPIPVPEPVVLAEDLVSARWQVFHKMERKPEFSAFAYIDMPAYVELEMQTSTGLVAGWMFEISFYLMAERQFAPPVAAPAPEPEAAPTQGGQGPRAPTRARPISGGGADS